LRQCDFQYHQIPIDSRATINCLAFFVTLRPERTEQLMGLVVWHWPFSGEGRAWRVHPCSDEKKIARRWHQDVPNLRSTFPMHANGDKIHQQDSTRYVLVTDALAIDFRAARQICCRGL
jgi:hypothetical protein